MSLFLFLSSQHIADLIDNSEHILVLRADANMHYTAVAREIRSTSSQVSRTVTTEIGQKITAVENILSQKFDQSINSITTSLNQSAISMSRSLAAEMCQTIIPAHEVSVTSAIARQICNSTKSIEATVSNSTADILLAINAQAYATQQISMALASLVRGPHVAGNDSKAIAMKDSSQKSYAAGEIETPDYAVDFDTSKDNSRLNSGNIPLSSPNRQCRRLSITLPKWMSECVWEVEMRRQHTGWQLTYRSYNIQPWDSLIFKVVRKGQLGKMRELFSSREASPFDRDYLGRTLLHVSCLLYHV